MEFTPAERVRQRRTQMLVHSFLYYEMNETIVSDDTWQRWADELVQLQAQHPAPIGFYDEEFADWDGATGMHLPQDGYVRAAALKLLDLHSRPAMRVPLAPAPRALVATPAPAQASLF